MTAMTTAERQAALQAKRRAALAELADLRAEVARLAPRVERAAEAVQDAVTNGQPAGKLVSELRVSIGVLIAICLRESPVSNGQVRARLHVTDAEIRGAAQRHLAEHGVLPSVTAIDKRLREAGTPAGVRRIRRIIAEVSTTSGPVGAR